MIKPPCPARYIDFDGDPADFGFIPMINQEEFEKEKNYHLWISQEKEKRFPKEKLQPWVPGNWLYDKCNFTAREKENLIKADNILRKKIKYKIGDKVRITAPDDHYGEVGEISQITTGVHMAPCVLYIVKNEIPRASWMPRLLYRNDDLDLIL